MSKKSLLLTVGFLFSGAVVGTASAREERASALESARLAFAASEYSKAVQILEEAAAADPQNPEFQFWLMRNFFELEEQDKAVRSGERAVAIAPENSEYHHWLGRTYGGKASQASFFTALSWAKKTHREFATAVQLDGRNFAARQDLIEYLCSAPGIAGGGEDKANPQIAELSAMDAAEGHYAEGNCRRQKKDFKAADREFTMALESAPKSADLIYDIGDYAMKRSQPDRLIAVADTGQKVDPSDPRGDFYRAVAFILQNERLVEAERLLRAYIQRAPTRTAYPRPAAAHEWLGRLFEQQGKSDAAADEYRAAAQLDPKNKSAREALKRLGKRAAS